MNGGNGEISAKKCMLINIEKLYPVKIHTGSSIGSHKHTTSDDINYILWHRKSNFVMVKKKYFLLVSAIFVKKGSEHSIINTGKEDLILLTIVVEQ